MLSVAGFKVAKEENLRDFTIEFFRDGMLSQKRWLQKVPCPVACTSDRHQRPEKFQNYAAALDDHQIEPVIMVAVKD